MASGAQPADGGLKGMAALLIASASFGSAAIFIRLAVGVPPMTLTFLRLAIAAAGVMVISKLNRTLRRLNRKHLFLTFAAAAALTFHFFTFIFAVQKTTVANATFLVNTSPIFLSVLAPVAIRERTIKVEALAVMLATFGVLLSASDAPGVALTMSLGDASALAAAVLASLYSLAGRVARLNGVPTTCYVAYVYSTANMLAFPLAYFLEAPAFPSQEALIAAIALALVPTLIGHSLYNYALATIKVVRAGVVPLLEPAIASLLAAFLFDEVPSLVRVSGYSLIVAAVLIVARLHAPRAIRE